MMCVRTSYYMVCTDCNNQFVDPKFGAMFGSEDEVKQQARVRGWQCDITVANGSQWDFCPRCYAAWVEDNRAEI